MSNVQSEVNSENVEVIANSNNTSVNDTSSNILSMDDFSTPSRKYEDIKMNFNKLANNMANITLRYLSRIALSDIHFNKELNMSQELLEEYYTRLIAARLKNVYEPYSNLYQSPGHFFPKGFSMKFAPMIDILQKVLANMEVTKLEEPAVRILPEIDLSRYLDKNGQLIPFSDANVREVKEKLEILKSKYNVPIVEGVPREIEGDPSFMKFCMINEVLRSIQPSVNPGILALVSISGHKLVTANNANIFNYYHDDVASLVEDNILSRS